MAEKDECEHPRTLRRALQEHDEMKDALEKMRSSTGQELSIDTALVKVGWKNFHFGNLLQMIIAGGIVYGVLVAVQMWRDAEAMWIRMNNSTQQAITQITASSKYEHDALRVMVEQNNVAIRFNTCVNAVPQDQRIHQLKKYSACWYMSQGYAYEDLGPQKPK